MVLSKDELEARLHAEKKQISDGRLKDDNPLDLSPPFQTLCQACRRGDLKVCQEMITEGVNINARDRFDYTPLILASLCGQYEVVQLLLESGALCERDTFQGERCLYNALNDRIRNLLLQYDYSKSTDPLQPLASHIIALLSREHPKTSDISLMAGTETFCLHKFILSARSPYFQKKLAAAPDTTSWRLSNAISPRAFEIAIRHLYLGELPLEISLGAGANEDEQYVLTGIEKLSRQLEIHNLWDSILEGVDRRIARQRRTDEVQKGRDQLEQWYRDNILKHRVVVDSDKASQVRWDQDNAIFADVLLRGDKEPDSHSDDENSEKGEDSTSQPLRTTADPLNGIPVGPRVGPSRSPSRVRKQRKSTLFPAHRAILLRSEFFSTMFSSSFKEAQNTDFLQIIPIDCSPDVLEVVLTFLYTEKADFPLDIAIDVLFAADQLLIEKLKAKAAVVISTLGSGNVASATSFGTSTEAADTKPSEEAEPVNIYDVIRAGWLTRVHRLEEFAARYIAFRMEDYIDEEDFADLIAESASRITQRQETDSIELLDDIRFYLSERFRLRFEDSGIDELMDEQSETMPSNDTIDNETQQMDTKASNIDEGVVLHAESPSEEHTPATTDDGHTSNGAIRTLDGEIAGDEFASDAINYQLFLGKIDGLLERLKLDA